MTFFNDKNNHGSQQTKDTVSVDTTQKHSLSELSKAGLFSAKTAVFYGDGNINLDAGLAGQKILGANVVAKDGADVTLGSGFINACVSPNQLLSIENNSSITLNASKISVGGSLFNYLNKTTVNFSGDGAGVFKFVPPVIGFLSTYTITVDQMGAGDKIIIPYHGDGINALHEMKNSRGVFNGYDPKTGYLTLSNGNGLFSAVKVKIKMTPEQYQQYSANRDQYLDGKNDTFTFPGKIPVDPVTCFARGTMIATVNGDVAIQDLRAGDLVLTKDNGAQSIKWIGSSVVENLSLLEKEKVRPIRIKAGALGKNSPMTDLLVSPQHRVLIRSVIAEKMFGQKEVLIAAKQLLQLDGIDVVSDMDTVEYFHMLFSAHEVVVSNGAETESLFTGAEALKSLPVESVEEIFAIFPELRQLDFIPASARILPSGRQGRKLVMRHLNNGKALVAAA